MHKFCLWRIFTSALRPALARPHLIKGSRGPACIEKFPADANYSWIRTDAARIFSPAAQKAGELAACARPLWSAADGGPSIRPATSQPDRAPPSLPSCMVLRCGSSPEKLRHRLGTMRILVNQDFRVRKLTPDRQFDFVRDLVRLMQIHFAVEFDV